MYTPLIESLIEASESDFSILPRKINREQSSKSDPSEEQYGATYLGFLMLPERLISDHMYITMRNKNRRETRINKQGG